MKNGLKKLAAVILAAVLIISAVPFAGSAAESSQSVGAAGGRTGDCLWKLDDNGRLTIRGNGRMGDYNYCGPWGKYIKEVVIEDGVKNIGNQAFYYCEELTGVTIGKDVTSIGTRAFNNCNQLTGLILPGSLISIGSYAFFQCRHLSSVTIPEGVTLIDSYAFSFCSRLTEITVPDSVETIGSNAFSETPWYDNQPDGLICAGKVAYKYKGTVPENGSVEIENGTKGIAGSAFYYCEGLKSVTIPDSVTNIGKFAFWGCADLYSIVIPDSVTSVGYGAFESTSWYDNQRNGLIYTGKVAYKYKGKMPANTSVVIKDGTNGIANCAFYECEGLTKVKIPDSVTILGGFSGCSNLTSVTIPESVTVIGSCAFETCTGLKSITIPDSVKIIDQSAFHNCKSLKSVEIGKGVTDISETAFSGCKSLTKVTVPDGVKRIGKSAFNNCEGLISVTIPKSVTSIENNVFSGCPNVTIYGFKGSVIETYAESNGLTFVPINRYEPGDANTDGIVDARDVTAIQRHVSEFELLTAKQAELADVNHDGEVTVADATLLQMYLAEFDVQIG